MSYVWRTFTLMFWTLFEKFLTVRVYFGIKLYCTQSPFWLSIICEVTAGALLTNGFCLLVKFSIENSVFYQLFYVFLFVVCFFCRQRRLLQCICNCTLWNKPGFRHLSFLLFTIRIYVYFIKILWTKWVWLWNICYMLLL